MASYFDEILDQYYLEFLDSDKSFLKTNLNGLRHTWQSLSKRSLVGAIRHKKTLYLQPESY